MFCSLDSGRPACSCRLHVQEGLTLLHAAAQQKLLWSVQLSTSQQQLLPLPSVAQAAGVAAAAERLILLHV